MGEDKEEGGARMERTVIERLRVCERWKWRIVANDSRVERVTRRPAVSECRLHLRTIRTETLSTVSSSSIFIFTAQLIQYSFDSSSVRPLPLPLTLALLLAPTVQIVSIVVETRVEVKGEVETRVRAEGMSRKRLKVEKECEESWVKVGDLRARVGWRSRL